MSTKRNAAAKPAAKAAPARTASKSTSSKSRTAAKDDTVSLDPIVEAMRKGLPKSRHAEAEAFIRAFYRRMSSDELPQHDAGGWAELATDFLDFARARKPGTALVRLFNPTMKNQGWESTHTVVQIANDDMPFLVDSVTMALAEQGIGVHVLGHPVVAFQRDKAGKLVSVGEGSPESLMHLEIDRQPAEAMPKIQKALEAVLADVRASVRDWPQMKAKMIAIADELGDRNLPVGAEGKREAQEFLRWAADNHFTFLGYREYEVVPKAGQEVLSAIKASGMGLLRGKDVGKPRLLTSLAAHYMPQSGSVDALILTKTNSRATVHRPGYMDYIGVLSFDAQGKPVREERFLGLYTSSAYNRRPWDIPLVRQRHNYVMANSGLAPDSHSGKALRHILESLPRDEMFQSSEEELLRTATGILGLQERVRSKLFLRRDRYGRFFSVLVYIPRDRFNTDVRLRIEAMLKRELHGEHVDSSVTLGGESPLAQVHLIVRPKSGEAIETDSTRIENELSKIVRNWQDDLREKLVARHGEQRGLMLTNTYGRALPAGYIEDVSADVAADDVEHLAALSGPSDLRLSLYRAHGGEGGLRFKFYRQNDDIPLSDALPMMENMGLRVISEHPYRLQANGQTLFVQDFEVETSIANLDVSNLDANFEEAFAQIWRGNAENDGFNRLILTANLSWRQVSMLRGYCKYLLQVGVPFSQSYVEETLNRYPLLARLLVELFEARFDPVTGSESKAEIKAGMEKFRAQLHALAHGDEATLATLQPAVEARAGKRDVQVDATRTALKGLFDRVASLDEDRILRSFIGVIDATLRTSYYIQYAPGESGSGLRADGGPSDYISFKFDSSKVPDLPKPRPYREIFVYGPRVEGVHLRFGPVARGGLRWSDRREDFRTEVLGLVKAQMVKNTVIVPVGSKGGFFAKQLPDPAVDRDAWFNEGVACYKTLHQRPAGHHRQPGERQGRAAGERGAPRQRRSVPGRRRRQGHRHVLRHRQRHRARARLLAGRRVRLGWLGGLRPQGHGHHRARCLGVGQAPLPRHGSRQPVAGLHRGRHRRHVGRRVRQRHAAERAYPPAGRVRPSPHLPRPESGRGEDVQGTRAHVRAAALELGRLRQVAHQQGRRRVPAFGQVDPAVAGDQGRARHRRCRDRAQPGRTAQRDPQGTGRPAVERRHRHVREVVGREQRRCWRSRQQRAARQRPRPALQGGGRGRQPGHDPAGPHRGRAARRAAQHRLHRQLRRRGHLRPRGEHQDPAQRRGAEEEPDAARAQQAAGADDRRGRPAGAQRQLPPEPGHQPDGADERAPPGFQAALHPHAGVAGAARPPDRVPAPAMPRSPSARRAARASRVRNWRCCCRTARSCCSSSCWTRTFRKIRTCPRNWCATSRSRCRPSTPRRWKAIASSARSSPPR